MGWRDSGVPPPSVLVPLEASCVSRPPWWWGVCGERDHAPLAALLALLPPGDDDGVRWFLEGLLR
jgi:hypothetical protein